MAEQKSSPPTWVPVKKGDPIPYQAVKGGYYHTDGILYAGKAENGEIGKYNTEKNKIYHLWAHASGRHNSGYIFVCDPDLIVWREYQNGMELPADAFLAGSYYTDGGDLYIGRRGGDRGGELGKLNVNDDGVTMCNLWTHAQNKTTTGQILCVKELLVSIEFGDLDLLGETPKVAHKATLVNEGDTELSQRFKWSEQSTTTESLTVNVGFEYSVKSTAEASFGILKASAEIGFTLSFGLSGTITHEDQKGQENEINVKVMPGKKVEVSATLTEKRGRLPFTLTFASGKKSTGYWEGVAQSAATVTTKNL